MRAEGSGAAPHDEQPFTLAQAQEEVEKLVKLAFWQIHRSDPLTHHVQVRKLRDAIMSAVWDSADEHGEEGKARPEAQPDDAAAVTQGTARIPDTDTSFRTCRVPEPQGTLPVDQTASPEATWPHMHGEHLVAARMAQRAPDMRVESSGCQTVSDGSGLETRSTQLSSQERRSVPEGLVWHKRMRLDPSVQVEQHAVPAEHLPQEVQLERSLQEVLPQLLLQQQVRNGQQVARESPRGSPQQQQSLQEERLDTQGQQHLCLQQNRLQLLRQPGRQDVSGGLQRAPEAQDQLDLLRLMAMGLQGPILKQHHA